MPPLQQQYDGVERVFGAGVRPQRHDEVVQAIAGVVGDDDDAPVGPVVVLRSVVGAVLTFLPTEGAVSDLTS